jgi:YesN/AraC family two-component response regulator
MGIGCCVSSIAELHESLFSAQHALKYSLTEGTDKVYNGNDQCGIFEGGLTLLQAADELALKQAIQRLHTSEVKGCIHALFDRRLEQIRSYPVYAYMLSLQILQVSLQALRERMPIDRKTYELEQVYEAVIDEQATLDALVQQTITGSLKLCDRYQQFTEQGHSRPIWLAITYIQEHYTQRITLDTLAAHTDRNPQYLSASFTKELGMSITEYITSLRIAQAKEFLITTDISISEIGSQVGYEDSKYFSRIFLKSTGESPRTYRLHHRLE